MIADNVRTLREFTPAAAPFRVALLSYGPPVAHASPAGRTEVQLGVFVDLHSDSLDVDQALELGRALLSAACALAELTP